MTSHVLRDMGMQNPGTDTRSLSTAQTAQPWYHHTPLQYNSQHRTPPQYHTQRHHRQSRYRA
eukprot:168167-Rhodomonas_salina.1